MGRFRQAPDKCRDTFAQRLAFETPRMEYKILRTDHSRAVQFPTERRNRFFPDYRVECRQIHQIVAVDDERHQIETFARCPKSPDVTVIGNAGAPLPGACGKDLECIRA
jgi:hypothetical protein